MDHESCIVEAFKALLREKPYDKLSVSEICLRANVSRKIFYGNFRDKQAIVEHLFNKHAIEPTKRLNALFSAEDLNHMGRTVRNRFYEGIYAEKEYYLNLAQTVDSLNPLFVSIVTNALCEWNRELFSAWKTNLRPEEFDYICYFYAASQAMFLQKWINSGMTLSPDQLASLYYEVAGGYLSKLAGMELKE